MKLINTICDNMQTNLGHNMVESHIAKHLTDQNIKLNVSS